MSTLTTQQLLDAYREELRRNAEAIRDWNSKRQICDEAFRVMQETERNVSACGTDLMRKLREEAGCEESASFYTPAT